MNILNALILTVFIAILIASSNAKISSTSSFLSITGGKSKPPSTSSIKSKKVPVKHSTKYEDDDEEDEDDEDDKDDYKKKSNKKTSKSTISNKKRSKKTSTALISTTDKRGKKKSKRGGGIQFPSINLNLNLKEKFDDLTKQGQSVYKDVYRRAKVCLLLSYLTYTPYFPLISTLIFP